MRRVMRTVIASVGLVCIAAPCFAIAVAIGPGRPMGERGFERQLRMNPELRSYVALRGYPDWVEEVEVDSDLPLDSHELRLYYLRLDREVCVHSRIHPRAPACEPARCSSGRSGGRSCSNRGSLSRCRSRAAGRVGCRPGDGGSRACRASCRRGRTSRRMGAEENLRMRRRDSEETIINNAVNQVLSRTIVTSLTVVLVLIPLTLAGGEVLHDFSLALLWGVIFGTYSSIFVASPLLLLWPGASGRLLKRS